MKTKEAYFYVQLVCYIFSCVMRVFFLSINSECNTRLGVSVKAKVKKVVPVHSYSALSP